MDSKVVNLLIACGVTHSWDRGTIAQLESLTRKITIPLRDVRHPEYSASTDEYINSRADELKAKWSEASEAYETNLDTLQGKIRKGTITQKQQALLNRLRGIANDLLGKYEFAKRLQRNERVEVSSPYAALEQLMDLSINDKDRMIVELETIITDVNMAIYRGNNKAIKPLIVPATITSQDYSARSVLLSVICCAAIDGEAGDVLTLCIDQDVYQRAKEYEHIIRADGAGKLSTVSQRLTRQQTVYRCLDNLRSTGTQTMLPLLRTMASDTLDHQAMMAEIEDHDSKEKVAAEQLFNATTWKGKEPERKFNEIVSQNFSHSIGKFESARQDLLRYCRSFNPREWSVNNVWLTEDLEHRKTGLPLRNRTSKPLTTYINLINQRYYALYDAFVKRMIPISRETRMKMIAMLQAVIKQVEVARVWHYTLHTSLCTVDENGNVQYYDVPDRPNVFTYEQFVNEVYVAISQLDSGSSAGLKAVPGDESVRTAAIEHNGTVDYQTRLADNQFPFTNPFDIRLGWRFPDFTGGKRKACIRKRYFIEYATDSCEEGACILSALNYIEPKASTTEFENIERLVIIANINKDHTWNASFTSKALRGRTVDQINLDTDIVLYDSGGHMYRVTKILPNNQSTRRVFNRAVKFDNVICYRPEGNGTYQAVLEYLELEAPDIPLKDYVKEHKNVLVYDYDGKFKPLFNVKTEPIQTMMEYAEEYNNVIIVKKGSDYYHAEFVQGTYLIRGNLVIREEPIPKQLPTDWIIYGHGKNRVKALRYSPSMDGVEPDPEVHGLYWKNVTEQGRVIKALPYIVHEETKKEGYIMFTYDFETCNKGSTVVPIICGLHGKGISYMASGPNCAMDIVDKLYELCMANPNSKVLAYTFNGAKFDTFILKRALARHKGFDMGRCTRNLQSNTKLTMSGSKIMKLVCRNLVLMDINRMVAGSLESVATSWELDYKKTAWDHNLTQAQFCRSGMDVTKFIESLKHIPGSQLGAKRSIDGKLMNDDRSAYECYTEYCMNDCKVTCALANTVRTMFLELTDGEIDSFDYMSLPQLGEADVKRRLRKNKLVPYKSKNMEEELFMTRATLAGRSQLFDTAPRGFQEAVWLAYLDISSQYPHVMQQCIFPMAGETVWTGPDEFMPGKLGFYEIRIIKQSTTVILPLKSSESGLGGHFWDYKGEFTTVASSVLLLDFWHLGGVCQIIKGMYFENSGPGMLTEFIETYKRIKLQEDMNKRNDKGKPKEDWKYNAAKRQGSKLLMCAVSGKMVQKKILMQEVIYRERKDIIEYIAKLPKLVKGRDGIDREARAIEIRLVDDNTAQEEYEGKNIPTIVKHDVSYDTGFDRKGSKIKPRAMGLFIYAWSQHHILHALLHRLNMAGAAFAMETDSLEFNRVKYETYCESIGIINPYWIDAPPKVDDPTPYLTGKPLKVTPDCPLPYAALSDPVFDPPVAPKGAPYAGILNGKRLGYLFCPKLAEKYALDHKLPFKKRDIDFGDMTCECGIENGELVTNACCYIGKKCSYKTGCETLPEDEGVKATFKGVGKSTRYAPKEMVLAASIHDEDTQREIMAKIINGPSVLAKHHRSQIYQRLASGEGVDVCEQRFAGNLDMLSTEEGTGLECTLNCKRLAPPIYMHLMVRGDGNNDYEKQYVTSHPKGELEFMMIDGKQLSDDEMDAIIVATKTNGSIDKRGDSFAFGEYGMVYVAAPTISYLLRQKVKSEREVLKARRELAKEKSIEL